MAKLTYVASGCRYMGISYKEVLESEALLNRINELLAQTNNRNKEHGLALLYNAFTEERYGKIFQLYKDSLDFIDADSGGLQMITRAMSVTEEKKNEIYRNQGQFSDYAMCFDEIPLKFTGVKSSRLDMSNRWFDRDLMEAAAKKTGQNISQQIKIFREMGSSAKPVLIVHGNCYDTYMSWAELALSQIPRDDWKYIGGVALGAAALGRGTLEDIRRAFYYTQLPEELLNINHMHLLAVGSLPRLLPNIVFIRSGVYGPNLHLTYDSTTHTSGIHMGRFYLDKGVCEFSREFDRKIWGKIHESVVEYTGLDLTLEHYHELMNMSETNYKEKYGSKDKLIEAWVAASVTSVNNFKTHVDLCLNEKDELLNAMDGKNTHSAFEALYNVKTLDDFRHWEHQVGRYLPTVPVANSATSSLEGFF